MYSPVYNIIYGNLFCVLISVGTCAEDASVSDGFPFSWGHLKTETICLSLKFYSIMNDIYVIATYSKHFKNLC